MLAGYVARRSVFAMGHRHPRNGVPGLHGPEERCGVARRIAVLFPGDQLPASLPSHLLELQDPLVQLEGLLKKFPAHTDFLVVFPSSITAEGFARYAQFLVSSSPSGEPSQYVGAVGKAMVELRRIVEDHCRLVPAEGRADVDVSLDVVGFSKGGVVLNQLLVEMGNACDTADDGNATRGADWLWAWQTVSALHYVDAGLNTIGAYVSAPETVLAFAAARRRLGSQLFVTIIGTWRQWADERRPWVRREADELAELLREGDVPVRVRYLGGPSGQAPATAFDGLEVHMKALASLDPSRPC